jgi:hypothetical protein
MGFFSERTFLSHLTEMTEKRPSARDLDIGPEGFSSRDEDISRGLMTSAISKRPCINLFITYFAKTDNMLLPFTRGQITCYCPRNMLLPQRQITRRKLCFFYTCKFDVISIKYVIISLRDIKYIGFKHQWENKQNSDNKFIWYNDMILNVSMLLPQRQITRRKLCFFYTCKFDVISIKYVIISD